MKKIFYFLFATLVIFSSCKKQAGFGGNASIKGKIMLREYNATATILLGEYESVDADVFIVADGDVSPTERVRTDYKGEYAFPYLYKGKYKVYAYSDDTTFTSLSGINAIVKEVEITSSKETVDLGTIMTYKLN